MKMQREIKYFMLAILVMLPVRVTNGQVLKDITARFQSYCKELPREEVYVHTDRNEYIAGEEIWFSTYLFDRLTNTPGYGSSIIYVEVLNPENHPVGQRRILTEKGFGSGEIVLPDTLASGCYTLRAYTAWMRNFFPFNCFVKKLNVYNALNVTGGFTCRMENDSINRTGNASSDQTDFAFSVTSRNVDNLSLMITASERFRASNSNLCYIFIETRGTVNHSALVNLPEPVSGYTVPSRYLTPGVNHITFFDTKGVPVSEKFVYTPGRKEYHPSVETPDSFAVRSSATVEIDVPTGGSFNPDSSNLSVSVTPVTDGRYDEISDYMVFGSEFGLLPDEITGKDPDNISPEVLNSFLGSVKSNWINWDNILKANPEKDLDMAEKESHFLYGRLLNRNTHQPVPEKVLFLSIPGKAATFQYAVSDRNGTFRFVVPVSKAEQEFIIQPEESDKNYSVEIVSSFSDKYPGGGYASLSPVKTIPDWIRRWSTNYQVNRIYGIGITSPEKFLTDKLPDRKRFYGKPDQELVMDDYIKLPVMQEVFYELIPGVSLKSRKNSYEISIVDPVDNRVQKIPPTLFIDGVMIDDASAIANLDPETVERIDIIKEKYFVGDYILYGLVNVITRSGDFSLSSLPEKALRLKYRVIDPESQFTVPEFTDPAKGNTNIPDFRNTLYWNPSLQTDKAGRCKVTFTTSDTKGEYIINVQGLTSEGKPLSARKTIRIN